MKTSYKIDETAYNHAFIINYNFYYLSNTHRVFRNLNHCKTSSIPRAPLLQAISFESVFSFNIYQLQPLDSEKQVQQEKYTGKTAANT